jgi:hypothetical protein
MLFQSAPINQEPNFINRKERRRECCVLHYDVGFIPSCLHAVRVGQSARYRAPPWETGDSCNTAICCGNWECQLPCSRGNPRLAPGVGSCTTLSQDRGRQAPTNSHLRSLRTAGPRHTEQYQFSEQLCHVWNTFGRASSSGIDVNHNVIIRKCIRFPFNGRWEPQSAYRTSRWTSSVVVP